MKLQQDIDTFVDWTAENALALNISKTKNAIFGNRHKLSKLKTPDHLRINCRILEFVKKVWLFGYNVGF